MLNIEKCHDMCIGKDMDENEKFLQISSQQKMTNNKRNRGFRDKNRSEIIISPTYQKHF